MAPAPKLFSLYIRKRKKGKPVFYARFKNQDGSWTSGKNTGTTNRNTAESWAINYLQGGHVVAKENITLEEFSRNFFSWDSEWSLDKRVTGKRISQRQCKENTSVLNNHILPALGKMKLIHIDKSQIKSLRNRMYDNGYSGTTINKILSCLKALLAFAEEKSLIRYVPKIERAANRPKQRGILTVEEVRRLFSIEWNDFRAYVMNLAAACTGLRRGELLALVLNQINHNYITVKCSWDEVTGSLNETTKTGRSRTVIIPDKLRSEIERLAQINPFGEPESFLFFSSIETKPMEGKLALKALFREMKQIGINKEERIERNITFHSWRHWFNSLLINAHVPLQKVQSITGHLTDEMSQHYYHVDEMGDVLQAIQNSLFIPETA